MNCKVCKNIKLKAIEFNMINCNCIYTMNCCNYDMIFEKIYQQKKCYKCNTDLDKIAEQLTHFYLYIYEYNMNKNNLDINELKHNYEILYMKMSDFAKFYLIRFAKYNINTVHNMLLKDIMKKVYDKNILEWFLKANNNLILEQTGPECLKRDVSNNKE